MSYAVVLNSCIDIDSTTSPRKQCFCAFGFFGQTCEKESGISDRVAVDDLDGYESRQLNDDATMYWKVLEDSREIEVVVKVRFFGQCYLYRQGWQKLNKPNQCELPEPV